MKVQRKRLDKNKLEDVVAIIRLLKHIVRIADGFKLKKDIQKYHII